SLNITIAGSDNITGVVYNTSSGNQAVVISINNVTTPYVEYTYNFTAGVTCNLANMSLYANQVNGVGTTYTHNICLIAPDTKTIWVDDVDTSTNDICLLDSEHTSITEISDACSGSGEVRISCTAAGASVISGSNTYTCSIVAGRYKISGLSHSGVREIAEIVVTPTTSTSSSGSSGGGSSGGGFTCTTGFTLVNGVCESTGSNATQIDPITGLPITDDPTTPPKQVLEEDAAEEHVYYLFPILLFIELHLLIYALVRAWRKR
ncbi:MAG: hypothetical protein ACI9P9_000733, partial [Patescibacteria group bacterium]